MGWTMLAPQVMDENARPPLEISPPLISKSLAPLPPILPPAPPTIRGGAFYEPVNKYITHWGMQGCPQFD